jgi:hypothetical protein
MKSGGEKNPKTFADGASSELSPNMNDNWALSFSDADLLKSEDEELPGRLVVFAPMSNLPAYQSRVNDILQTPGIGDRVTELRAAAKNEALTETKKPRSGRSKPAAQEAGSFTVPTVPSSLPGTGKMAPPGLPNITPESSSAIPGSSSGGSAAEPPKPASGKLAPPPPPSI